MRFKSDITSEAQLILEKYISTNYDGNLSYILGVDGSGNVIKQASTDFLTSVPTLQQVTDAGATTTKDIILNGGRLYVTNTGNASLYVERAAGAEVVVLSQSNLGAIGTQNNFRFDIKSNGAARASFLTNGNVGIGITTPNARLDVNSGASGNIASFKSGAVSSGDYAGITLHTQTNSNADWYGSELRSINTASSPGSLNPRLGFFTQDHNTYLPADRTEKMSILGNGNVGIGTTSPSANLHVNGGVLVGVTDLYTPSAKVSIESAFGGYPLEAWRRSDFGEVIKFGRSSTYTSGNHYGYLGIEDNGEVTIGNNGNEALRVDSIQKVGIGTTTVSAKLHVVGGAAATNATTLLVENAEGEDILVVKDGGNVGIGTTSPSAGLEVGENTTNKTKSVVFNSEGGGEAGLTIQSRTNRAKLKVADNDTVAHVIAEGNIASYGMADSASSNNISVLSSGNVGIGTTSPSAKLEVAGQIKTDIDAAESSHLLLHSGTSGVNVDFNFYIGSALAGLAPKNLEIIGSSSASDIAFSPSYTSRGLLMLDGSANLVGIGTTTPSAKTHIVGGAAATDATTFLVENAEGDDLLKITDGGNATISGSEVNITSSSTANSTDADINITTSATGTFSFGNVNIKPQDNIYLEPVEGSIHLNTEKSYIEITTDSDEDNTTASINITADRNNGLTNTVADININAHDDLNLDAGKDFTLDADTIDISAQTTVDGDDANITISNTATGTGSEANISINAQDKLLLSGAKVQMPVWATDGNRPSASSVTDAGVFGFNITRNTIEIYNGTSWVQMS